jgi:hypothetical protein
LGGQGKTDHKTIGFFELPNPWCENKNLTKLAQLQTYPPANEVGIGEEKKFISEESLNHFPTVARSQPKLPKAFGLAACTEARLCSMLVTGSSTHNRQRSDEQNLR